MVMVYSWRDDFRVNTPSSLQALKIVSTCGQGLQVDNLREGDFVTCRHILMFQWWKSWRTSGR